MLKCEKLKILLLHLYQACFTHSNVPTVWKQAFIKPIPKGSDKDPHVPLNYRGISLISCVSKLYSSILNNRIVKFYSDQNVFADEQNGFRQNRSCEDHIFVLNSVIENRMNAGKATFCAFIDLEKAFDWLNRDLLLHKLSCSGINGPMYFAIQNLLVNTKSKICLSENVSTGWFDVECGVRQGDPLSPTLFNLFINDLTGVLKTKCPQMIVGEAVFNSLLYADDMVLIAESEVNLQKLLNELNKWCQKWRIKINDQKSKVVHFRKSRVKETEIDFILNNVNLEKMSSYKYLGVIFDENLKYEKCIKSLADSASRALGAIINKFKCLKNVGFNTFEKLYDCGVIPITEYGGCVWGFRKKCEIDLIQNRAMRFFLGIHKFAPVDGMLGDIGWHKPYVSRYKCIFRFWNRMIAMDNDRLTKKVFNANYDLCNNNWSSNFELLLNDLNYGNLFLRKQQLNIDRATDVLIEKHNFEWKCNIAKKPKLRTYIEFKKELYVEPFVQHCHNRKRRSYMSQLRLGILPIMIETGRYKNIPANERLCEFCVHHVEDEKHFILDCEMYKVLRIQLFDKIVSKQNDFKMWNKDNQFKSLMSVFWKETSCYIDEAWKFRQDALYINNI